MRLQEGRQLHRFPEMPVERRHGAVLPKRPRQSLQQIPAVDVSALDEAQGRTHRILQVAAEDIPFLRELDVNMGTLEVFRGYAGLKAAWPP